MRKYGGVIPLLTKFYPEHDWTTERTTHPSKDQIFLFRRLQQLFPNAKVLMEYKRLDMRFKTGHPMSFDIAIPEHALVFEYQGKQHFGSHFLFGSNALQTVRFCNTF
jgi:hypothetical protein